jgi:hypothetical protein
MCLELLEASIFWSPEGLSRPLMGKLYLCKNNSVHIFESERQKVKVKESRYRRGVAQRVPGGLGFQIFMTFGT